MSTRILGVHAGPDASACLLVDNRLVASVARERLTRRKHDGGEPLECVDALLAAAGLKAGDIDLVVRCGRAAAPSPAAYEAIGFARVQTTRRHHLLHAYAASVMAPPGRALVMVVDGQGCSPEDNGVQGRDAALREVESVYLHEQGRLTELDKIYRPLAGGPGGSGVAIDSLGEAYAAVSRRVFGSGQAAGKLMALAALATGAQRLPEPLLYGPDTPFALNPDWLACLAPSPQPLGWQAPRAADLAANVQRGLEGYMAWRTRELARRHQCSQLLLGGGVALNCKNNGLLANAGWLSRVDIFPAAGNDGLAVGAAVMALREIFGDHRPLQYQVSQGPCVIEQVIEQADRQTLQHAADALAHRLAQGRVVGVVQGGSEFGPRALGYRSILSAATDLAFKTRLNEQIKRREPFRPFGGIVLASRLAQLTPDRLAGPHMLSAARMNEAARASYPALAHLDGTVRLQLVEEDGGLLHRMLQAYEALTERVALINTSFNACDEPIVETLAQARACAAAIGLDHLYAQGHLENLRP